MEEISRFTSIKGGIHLRGPYPTAEEIQAVRNEYLARGEKVSVWGGYGVINIYHIPS